MSTCACGSANKLLVNKAGKAARECDGTAKTLCSPHGHHISSFDNGVLASRKPALLTKRATQQILKL
jgi:hypothetical protein